MFLGFRRSPTHTPLLFFVGSPSPFPFSIFLSTRPWPEKSYDHIIWGCEESIRVGRNALHSSDSATEMEQLLGVRLEEKACVGWEKQILRPHYVGGGQNHTSRPKWFEPMASCLKNEKISGRNGEKKKSWGKKVLKKNQTWKRKNHLLSFFLFSFLFSSLLFSVSFAFLFFPYLFFFFPRLRSVGRSEKRKEKRKKERR